MNNAQDNTDSQDVTNLGMQNSLTITLRIFAWVKQFVIKLRKQTHDVSASFEPNDISAALMLLPKQEQSKFFPEEIKVLNKEAQKKSSSKIIKMSRRVASASAEKTRSIFAFVDISTFNPKVATSSYVIWRALCNVVRATS